MSKIKAKTVVRAVTVLVTIVALGVVGAAAGFLVHSVNAAGSVTTLEETGSSLLAPYFGTLAPAYQAQHKNVLVAAATTDSGTGIKDAESGLAAIGGADLPAPATPGIVSIPITVAGVAIVYNLPGVSNLNLNGKVLAGIYSGRITRWNDPAIQALNGGVTLPALAITPLERSDSSGTTYQFTSYLQQQSTDGWPIPGKTQAWPVGTPTHGSNAMVTGSAKTAGSIAYVGVSYEHIAVSQYHLGVAALADGSGQYLLPTQANIAASLAQFAPQYPAVTSMIDASNGYPIVNYEYAVVKEHQTTTTGAAAIRSFLQWTVTTGSQPRYLDAFNFEPLPARVLAASQQMIGSIR